MVVRVAQAVHLAGQGVLAEVVAVMVEIWP